MVRVWIVGKDYRHLILQGEPGFLREGYVVHMVFKMASWNGAAVEIENVSR